MTRIVYINNKYLDEKNAKISIFDRGLLFADAVYEVTAVINGKLIDFSNHVMRLNRSLKENILLYAHDITVENFNKVLDRWVKMYGVLWHT